jgi:hypothetical protein
MMEIEQFEAKLKQNLDMSIFSRLLEMDHEESRSISAKALFGFIEKADKTVNDIKDAL